MRLGGSPDRLAKRLLVNVENVRVDKLADHLVDLVVTFRVKEASRLLDFLRAALRRVAKLVVLVRPENR